MLILFNTFSIPEYLKERMQLKADRQYYIDWLRAGAMFLLVFYHSARLFDDPD